MKKICILSGLHLSTNPRVWKTANTLADAGYQVVIITNWVSEAKLKQDRDFIHHKNIVYRSATNLVASGSTTLRGLFLRGRRRISGMMKQKLGIESKHLLGFSPHALIREALTERADLYLAHTELGFYAGKILCKKGMRVAFDFEDWYSRDYLVPERPVSILRSLEAFAMVNGIFVTCPSNAMAIALMEAYPSKHSPVVIYNGFSIKEDKEPAAAQREIHSAVWFSQVIGPGRGIEIFFQMLEQIHTPVHLHLAGFCSPEYRQELEKKFPSGQKHQLLFHPSMPHRELISFLRRYTIGIATEQKHPDSRDKTVTNKILQYLLAGMKVLATDTGGQREIAEKFPGTIELADPEDPKSWVIAFEQLLSGAPADEENIRKTYQSEFSWEAQEKKLLFLVQNAVGA